MWRMLSEKDLANQCGKEAYSIGERLSPEKIYGQWEVVINNIANHFNIK